ncbi:MAG TPA: glycoside hydrolase family 2, partial [Flavisolibacter sp.]|nr:glycoside hydrolase family 2 [Flavisolibacter sp.]
KAYAGTATYKTTFSIKDKTGQNKYVLDLGNVDMAATVILNGETVGNLWAPPYRIDLNDAVKKGENILEVQVTSTWFNRLVFDAGQSEAKRKTWVINGPKADTPLRASGLIGPVSVQILSLQKSQ